MTQWSRSSFFFLKKQQGGVCSSSHLSRKLLYGRPYLGFKLLLASHPWKNNNGFTVFFFLLLLLLVIVSIPLRHTEDTISIGREFFYALCVWMLFSVSFQTSSNVFFFVVVVEKHLQRAVFENGRVLTCDLHISRSCVCILARVASIARFIYMYNNTVVYLNKFFLRSQVRSGQPVLVITSCALTSRAGLAGRKWSRHT